MHDASRRPVRVALLGADDPAAADHIRIIQGLAPAVALAAVVDPRGGPGAFASYGALCASWVPFDVAMILGQPETHNARATAALSDERHVMFDQPLGADAEDARAIINAAERWGVQLDPCHATRFMLLGLGDVVAEHLAGGMREMYVVWDRLRPLATSAARGGVFTAMGLPILTAVHSVLGQRQPTSVSGELRRSAPGAPEYLAAARIEYDEDFAVELELAVGPAASADRADMYLFPAGGPRVAVRLPLTTYSADATEAVGVNDPGAGARRSVWRALTLDQCRRAAYQEMVGRLRYRQPPSTPVDPVAIKAIAWAFHFSARSGGLRTPINY